MWDVTTGRIKTSWKAHDGHITFIEACDDDTCLSSSMDGTSAVWNVPQHAKLQDCSGFGDCVAWCKERQHIVVGLKSGRLGGSREDLIGKHQGGVTALAFMRTAGAWSPRERTVACCVGSCSAWSSPGRWSAIPAR